MRIITCLRSGDITLRPEPLMKNHDEHPAWNGYDTIIALLVLIFFAVMIALTGCVSGPTAPVDADWCTIITVDPATHTSEITHGPCPLFQTEVIRR